MFTLSVAEACSKTKTLFSSLESQHLLISPESLRLAQQYRGLPHNASICDGTVHTVHWEDDSGSSGSERSSADEQPTCDDIRGHNTIPSKRGWTCRLCRSDLT
jgi:hypothetical protein